MGKSNPFLQYEIIHTVTYHRACPKQAKLEKKLNLYFATTPKTSRVRPLVLFINNHKKCYTSRLVQSYSNINWCVN